MEIPSGVVYGKVFGDSASVGWYRLKDNDYEFLSRGEGQWLTGFERDQRKGDILRFPHLYKQAVNGVIAPEGATHYWAGGSHCVYFYKVRGSKCFLHTRGIDDWEEISFSTECKKELPITTILKDVKQKETTKIYQAKELF